jgi:hypothetical protein
MCRQIDNFAEAPRGGLVGLREEPADFLAKLDGRYIHQHKREQEAWNGKAQKTEKSGEVVADRIFLDG